MSCNQDDIKKFPWTPERVAALYKDVRDNYIGKGVTDFPTIVKGMSADYGIKPEIIMKGLSRPEGSARRATNEMWLRAQEQRKIEQQARGMVPQMETPQWKQTASTILNLPRSTTLFGHFGAFSKSHLSDQAFYNPRTYAANFKNSWALLTKGGRAAHEIERNALFSDADPAYVAAKRSGLDVGQGTYAREISEVTGKTGPVKNVVGNVREALGMKRAGPDRVGMAFEQLQMSRFKIWKKELANLSPEERSNPDQLKALAAVLNHDTGATARSFALARFMFLSPRLFPAQLAHTFADIPKALYDTGLGMKWKDAAPASRYVARKTAILVGAQAAMLAANYGVYLATGDEKWKPNLTKLTSSLGRINIGGYSIPTSPTIELAKLPLMMIAAGIAARKGDSKTLELLRPVVETALGRQNPLFTIIEEAITGQTPGSNRPTPFPGLMGKDEPTKGKPTQGWMEYAGTKMPIPMANYLREFNDELGTQGMDQATRESIIKSLAVGTAELATSYHGSPNRERTIPPPTIFDLPGLKQLTGQPDYTAVKPSSKVAGPASAGRTSRPRGAAKVVGPASVGNR